MSNEAISLSQQPSGAGEPPVAPASDADKMRRALERMKAAVRVKPGAVLQLRGELEDMLEIVGNVRAALLADADPGALLDELESRATRMIAALDPPPAVADMTAASEHQAVDGPPAAEPAGPLDDVRPPDEQALLDALGDGEPQELATELPEQTVEPPRVPTVSGVISQLGIPGDSVAPAGATTTVAMLELMVQELTASMPAAAETVGAEELTAEAVVVESVTVETETVEEPAGLELPADPATLAHAGILEAEPAEPLEAAALEVAAFAELLGSEEPALDREPAAETAMAETVAQAAVAENVAEVAQPAAVDTAPAVPAAPEADVVTAEDWAAALAEENDASLVEELTQETIQESARESTQEPAQESEQQPANAAVPPAAEAPFEEIPAMADEVAETAGPPHDRAETAAEAPEPAPPIIDTAEPATAKQPAADPKIPEMELLSNFALMKTMPFLPPEIGQAVIFGRADAGTERAELPEPAAPADAVPEPQPRPEAVLVMPSIDLIEPPPAEPPAAIPEAPPPEPTQAAPHHAVAEAQAPEQPEADIDLDALLFGTPAGDEPAPLKPSPATTEKSPQPAAASQSPVRPADPLAPLRAMSDEEKIALFE